ncbi:sigma-70 family RNA polymerase sigma factor [Rathayibacter caricis DSM 15933]|jgi:RNA polymerase sigma-70 factor (ECF subfamily)|uniref:Sigma-70 family RNA polymerase sigma factor n=1 Tax=Rathayibacter caricis DSM 15933 TaxID=1328867 RepID=A0A2T4USR7_9MICO|nr:sigma-70 family RNA polymerase sigma factor [Rathayibacter caricis]PTL72565.1 sigma-70 family RNA polymerase sigma factor [Rathayibacter caricis DSM 15933]
MPPADERRERFEALVARTADPVRRYLLRRTDAATADDVLSETMIVLWRRIDAVPEEEIAWAIGVARLQLANAERGRRRQDRLAHRILVVDPPRETGSGIDDDVADAVSRVLAQMKPADAELLRLSVWEELAPREIADVLGATPGAVSVRLHRARARFAALWSKTGGAAGHAGEEEGSGR